MSVVSQDAFFYSLVYDPQQKTLLADKGEIRVGQRYQAEVKVPLLKEGTSPRSLTGFHVRLCEHFLAASPK